MALETKLVQKMSQSLMMTPQLQQAIKLLQMGRLEFVEAIEQEIQENPVLEDVVDEERREDSESDDRTAEQKETEVTESPADWEQLVEQYSDYRSTSPSGSSEERPSLEATLTKKQTLSEYLIEQVRMSDFDTDTKLCALILICNLNKHGFLAGGYDEICQSAGISLEQLMAGLNLLRTLDPIGVGARDLSECLLFQLEELGQQNTLAWKIVTDHLDALAKRHIESIAKKEGVANEEVLSAMKIIQSLEPRPARQFADDDTTYVVPDVYVRKVNGEWVITLNEDGMPKLRVSPYYLDMLRDKAAANKGNREYLNERLKAASWIIKSIHQRQQTILKVAQSIVTYQSGFLENGIQHLKPLVLRDVADDIGMHESTVSRVTSNKYIHTPQGVFELKFFFSTGIRTDDGEVSSSAVKDLIEQYVKTEDSKRPISDQKIVELLAKENIHIARRTVAKYREGLGIPSSSRRKALF
jgi:RNA polymerase sigma-54 factor